MNLVSNLALGIALAAGHLPLAAQASPETASQAAKEGLRIGAPAPAFKAGRWLKGTPVTTFAKGHVYVVEFWATWCGPCKMSIPHLTELAKEYKGKATFIGVDILEAGHGGDASKLDGKLDAFVAEMGPRMDYSVCRDTAENHMEKNWFKAGQFNGIPACVVVDGQGKVAWTGHPSELNLVLPAVTSATYDAKALGADITRDQAAKKEIYNAIRAKDFAAALALVEKFKPLPSDKSNFKELTSFQALLHLDGKRAEALFNDLQGKPALQTSLGQILVYEQGLEKVWYERAIPFLEKACEEDKGFMGLVAKACFLAGQAEKAVTTQKAYIDWLKAGIAKEPDKAAGYQMALREARADLAEYRPE